MNVAPLGALASLPTVMLWAGRVGGYTAAQVEEVRMVMRMLPIFFTTILFWTIYCQAGFQTSDTQWQFDFFLLHASPIVYGQSLLLTPPTSDLPVVCICCVLPRDWSLGVSADALLLTGLCQTVPASQGSGVPHVSCVTT